MITDMFQTHTGEMVMGARLQAARDKVADDYLTNAQAIRDKDLYADHVTEDTKRGLWIKATVHAEDIRTGNAHGFTTWQRINYELTGESIALLP